MENTDEVGASPDAKFKVGDRVLVVGATRGKTGCVGEVLAFDASDDEHLVLFGDDGGFWIPSGQLEATDGSSPSAVFETPNSVPAEPDARRRRVSNQLYHVLSDVLKLEGDFEYQYGYGRELVEQVAAANAKAEAASEQAAKYHDEISMLNIECSLLKEKSSLLEGELVVARGRAGTAFLLAGWAAGVAAVIAFGKFAATQIDALFR